MIMLHIFFVKKHLHRYKWFLQLVALLLKNLSHNTNVPYGNMGCQVWNRNFRKKQQHSPKKIIVHILWMEIGPNYSKTRSYCIIYLILYPSPRNLTIHTNIMYKCPRIPTLKHGKACFKYKSYSIFSHTDIHTYHTFFHKMTSFLIQKSPWFTVQPKLYNIYPKSKKLTSSA